MIKKAMLPAINSSKYNELKKIDPSNLLQIYSENFNSYYDGKLYLFIQVNYNEKTKNKYYEICLSKTGNIGFKFINVSSLSEDENSFYPLNIEHFNILGTRTDK